MVSPSARRRAVKMSVEEGIGKVAAACRALGLSRSSYYRSGQSSLESRRIRKEVLELSAKHPRYGYKAHYDVAAAGRIRGQCETSGADSTRRRNQSKQETTTNEAAGGLDGRAAAGGTARPSVELGLRSRPDGKWQQFSHPHLTGRTYPAMPGHSSCVVDPGGPSTS